jgi:hypothetical protein
LAAALRACVFGQRVVADAAKSGGHDPSVSPDGSWPKGAERDAAQACEADWSATELVILAKAR